MEGLDSAPAIKPRSGDNDYRAYIGGPGRYDVLAAANFNVLIQAGLREKHRVLDVGCGSLRLGRLLIPFLLPGGYYGIEPNQWLVDEGFDRELGRDIIELKQPRFLYKDDFSVGEFETTFDYAIAYSVFSHSYPDLAGLGLRRVGETLADDGVLLGTYFEGGPDVHRRSPTTRCWRATEPAGCTRSASATPGRSSRRCCTRTGWSATASRVRIGASRPGSPRVARAASATPSVPHGSRRTRRGWRRRRPVRSA